MSDHVFVKNLCLHGYHGVLGEETQLGQRFFLDISCETDHRPSATDDDYAKAVCYATLCKLAEDVFSVGPYKLIETLAQRIAENILARFDQVKKVEITVRKPSAPVPAVFDHVGVSVVRCR